MPSESNQLPDDDEPTRQVGGMEEGDSHDHEEPNSDSETFEPLCLKPEQLTYLFDNMIPAERSELNERVQATQRCFLPKSAISDPCKGNVSVLDTNKFIMNMYSRVTARLSAAGTAVPPTVPQTEQEDDRGEQEEEEEEERDEEHARATEGAMSEAGTVPPRSETPTQP